MRREIAAIVFAYAGAVNAQTIPGIPTKFPVTPEYCAATFTATHFNKSASPTFETMRQYFYSLSVVKNGQDQADKKIAAASTQLGSLSLEDKMSMGRACGYEYLKTNSLIQPRPQT